MGTTGPRTTTSNANPGRPPNSGCRWLALYLATALIVALGLGGLAAHDLQPLTQQNSLGGETSYLLTHSDALLDLLPYVVSYIVIMGLLSFIGLVLDRLVPPWADEVAAALDAWLRLLFSRFYSRYRKHLYYHLRTLDQKDNPAPGPWSLDLEQVFVDLKVEPQALNASQASPVQPLSPELRKGQHRFFDFLLPRYRGGVPHLVVIGPPGSGKTTMLRHTAFVLASGRNAQHTARMPVRLRRLVPVLLYLREHAAHVQQAYAAANPPNPTAVSAAAVPYSLEEAVNEHLRLHAADLSVPKGWLLRQLRRGRCLVLLDGLDEVADGAQRRQLVAWVQGQMDTYSSCRFVVTSRPHGFKGNALGGVTVLGMCPYTRTQLRTFVHNWYHATEVRRNGNRDDEGVKQQAQIAADELLQKMDDLPDIYALATNPLLLTMICTVHLYTKGLPERRVELYKAACDVLLVDRQRAKGLPVPLKEEQAKGVLAPLAWAMMSNPWLTEDGRRWPRARVELAIAVPLSLHTTMTAEEFLRYTHESGLFLELEPGEYGFAHLTFQEYLAAVHAATSLEDADIITHIGDSWWEETIRLYCAQADAAHASAVIEACLPQGDVLPQAETLALALACLDEASLVRPATRSRVQAFIDRCVEAPDAERQHLAAEALLARRFRDLVYLADRTQYHPALITCIEYQLFLDETGGQSKHHEPPHWTAPHFAPGTGQHPVLGTLPLDVRAFCGWLTERNASKGIVFRIPWVREAQSRQLQGTIHSLDVSADIWASDETGQFALVRATPPSSVVRTTKRAESIQQLETILRQDADAVAQQPTATRRSELTGTLARIHTLVYNRILASSGDFIRSLAYTRELAGALAYVSTLAGVSALTTELASARDSAHELAREFAYHSAHANAAERLAHALVGAITVAGLHAQNLVDDLTRALAYVGSSASTPELTRTEELARSIAGAKARASALSDDLANGYSRVSDAVVASALDDDLARAKTLADDLAGAFTRAIDQASVLADVSVQASTLARSGIKRQDTLRISLLVAATATSDATKGRMGTGPRSPARSGRQPRTDGQKQFELLIDLYTAMVVLQGRTEGWLQPAEGILLVCDLPQQAPAPTPAPAPGSRQPITAHLPGHRHLPGGYQIISPETGMLTHDG